MRSVIDEPSREAQYREPQQARSRATLMRLLEAAEDVIASVGWDELTMTGVAERAGVSVGSIYRRFEGKDQLVNALADRMLEQLKASLAENLRAAESSLSGVMDAYVHALIMSFAAGSRFAVSLPPSRNAQMVDRGVRTRAELHRILFEAVAPYTDQIRRFDPQVALEAVERTIIGACVHTAVRPDRPADEAGWNLYADQLSDMALAYLLSPDRRSTARPPTAS